MSQVRPIEDLFAELVELESVAERDAFLTEVCGGDKQLRRRLEKLLAANAKAGSFLQDDQGIEPTVDLDLGAKLVGSNIGPYKLREVIGEGGMGTVYVAEQEKPLRRKVALKVIKAGMDSKAVIARFEAERNALALMNHPNIAKVLDAGTTEQGRPFFAMELVSGIPITEYCDEHKLSIDQRLELFVQVCQAIQHAHQKGIIHRDIKPTNVLVTELDGKSVPKVIDFGVAKALNQSLSDHSIYTSFQSVIGTPLYMSPEQASLSAVDVDTRSDVYSLGVLLYELLTGTTPFEQSKLNEAAQHEVLRIIREEEPPRPSNRISTLGETASRVSQLRQTEPERLGRLVKGDLDWIVMTALAKERSRRYESASRLAEDLQRHLKNEVVDARPPSTAYRLARFYQRNKVAVIFASSFLCLFAFAVPFTAIGWHQARLSNIEKSQLLTKTHDLLIDKMLQQALLGNVDNVKELVVTAQALGISEDWRLTAEGVAFLHEGNYKQARELLETALNHNSNNVASRAMLLIANYHLGATEQWRKQASDIESWHPRKRFAEFDRLCLGYAWYYVDFKKSADVLSSELEGHPDWIVPRAVLAAALAETANTRGDRAYIKRALREIKGPRAIAGSNEFVSIITLFVYNNAIRLGHEVDETDASVLAESLNKYSSNPLARMLLAEYYVLTEPGSERELNEWLQLFNNSESFFTSVSTAELFRLGGSDERIRAAMPDDPEGQISQAMVLASLPGEDNRVRAWEVYQRLSKSETSWDMRYKLLQLGLLSGKYPVVRHDCGVWLDEGRAIIRHRKDDLLRSAMEFMRRDEPHPDIQSGSPDARFVANYVTALRARAQDQREISISHLETCTSIPINFSPESSWARALLERWNSTAQSGNRNNETPEHSKAQSRF